MSNSRRGRIDLAHVVWLSHKVGWKVKSIPVMQWRWKGNADVGKGSNEGTDVWLVGSMRSTTTRRVEFIANLVESSTGRVECSAERFDSSTVRVECSAYRFESSILQVEIGIVQDELIALLHIFLNNWKWWKRCVNVVYCNRVDGDKSEVIRWCCKVIPNLREVTVPPGQRERREPNEVVIESKNSHIIFSGGTMWRKVFEVEFGTEYDCIIDGEVKWSGEWWIIESREGVKMMQ